LGDETATDRLAKGTREGTHQPPTIAELLIFFDDLDALTGMKGDFVIVFWDKVMPGINVFGHGRK
jgi:hypothetical protein